MLRLLTRTEDLLLERHPYKRRAFLGISLVGLLTLASPAGCGFLDSLLGRRPRGRLIIVFLDRSASVAEQDWTIYAATCREVIARLQPGDKIALGIISDVPLPRFVPEVVRDVPWTGVELNDAETAAKVGQALLREVEALRRARRGSRSYILDTLNFGQQLIEADSERQAVWIVLGSDMLEDSEDLRFDTMRLDTQRIRSIIARRRERNLLPNLHGAQVFVAGASGTSTQQFQQVKEFWLTYFAAANAKCGPGMYGRTVPRFPSEPSRNELSRS
jgi:hypothetical protein